MHITPANPADMTVSELRTAGYAVVMWAPDDIPEGAARLSLEIVAAECGNKYLNLHGG